MDEFFKGYVPTKNKKCLVPFKGMTSKQLHTYEQVRDLEEYAGILAEDAVLVDLDNYEESEILMDIIDDLQINCRVYGTDKGKHFLFKNSGMERCKTNKLVAIGLHADIKVGKLASYCIRKYNGRERKVLYDIFEDEQYSGVPRWLYPICTSMDFLEIGAGGGRNDALFRYILTLQAADFSVEEARECIEIINKYVLKDPLPADELEVILRDEAFSKPIFFKKNTFLFNEFATYLKNNRHIVKINNNLHIYKDGIYEEGSEKIEAAMIQLIPTLASRQRVEVLKYLSVSITDNIRASSANYIAFNNGVYNIVDGSFGEFSDQYIITNRIPHNYDPDAYSEVCDKTFLSLACGDEEIKMLLEEMIGYCFYRSCSELRKCFILTGEKRNGKSTFLEVINYLLGDENIAALDVKELNDRFKTSELVSKLANIGDDISDDFITNPAVFKKLVSGNRVNVERKGQNPFDFNNYAKLLFSCNSMPHIKDKTGAVKDRMILIPFEATFEPGSEGYDPFIKHKLMQEEVMSHIINVALAGLKRILQNREFTEPDKCKQLVEEYNEMNNPILTFFNEIDKNDVLRQPVADVYYKYTEFCNVNGLKAVGRIEFSKRVMQHFNVKSDSRRIGFKSVRIFIKK